MSREFTDSTRGSWSIVIDADAVARVKAATGIDFATDRTVGLGVAMIRIGAAIKATGEDWQTAVNILWAALEPQARAKNVQREHFEHHMHHQRAFDDARDSLVEAIIDSCYEELRAAMTEAWANWKAGK